MSTLNRTAAEIAAAALIETFPDVKLWGGSDTSVGFFYDFYFPHPVSPNWEVLIEERMRQIARERRPIRTLEMVPVSAREFLLKEGRASRLNEIDDDEVLVELIEMGSFVDLSPAPHLKNSNELSAFKLWEIENLGKGNYRLTGCAFDKKEDLKIFLKKFRGYKEKSHLSVGEKKSLWKIWRGEVLWLQDGINGIFALIQLLRENLFKESLEISSASLDDRLELHAAFAEEIKQRPLSLAEVYQTSPGPWDPNSGLFSGDGGRWIQISFYPSAVDQHLSVISSLQSLGKTLNILGFKYCLRLTRPARSEKGAQKLLRALEVWGVDFEVEEQERSAAEIRFLVEDNLGRHWAAFSCQLVEKGFYVIGSIERLYALLLERSV